MEQNNSKRVLLSVLGVAILIVAVVGISFATLNYDKVGGTNSITTGTVTMSFSEVTNGIALNDALPIADSKGKGLAEYFDFSVSTSASAALAVKYEINVTPVTITESETVGALVNKEVKVYLEKKNDSGSYVEEVAPTLVSDLTESVIRTGSRILKSVEVNHTQEGILTDEYRLRIWVDENVDVDNLSGTQGKHFEYRLKVNVDGSASAIGA